MIKEAMEDLKAVKDKYVGIPCGRGCEGCPLDISESKETNCILWAIGNMEMPKIFKVEVHSYYYVEMDDRASVYDADIPTDELLDNLVITNISEVDED